VQWDHKYWWNSQTSQWSWLAPHHKSWVKHPVAATTPP
jgi:hypothetical protein